MNTSTVSRQSTKLELIKAILDGKNVQARSNPKPPNWRADECEWRDWTAEPAEMIRMLLLDAADAHDYRIAPPSSEKGVDAPHAEGPGVEAGAGRLFYEPGADPLFDTEPANYSRAELCRALWVCSRISQVYALADERNGGPASVRWEDIDDIADEADKVLGNQRMATLIEDARSTNGADDPDLQSNDKPRP